MKPIDIVIPKYVDYLKGSENEPLDDEFLAYSDEEITRIVELFKVKGFFITRQQASFLWEVHSHDWAANWLSLPQKDEHLWKVMLDYWKISKRHIKVLK